MNTLALETLPSISLDDVTGGAGIGANLDVRLDGNRAIDSIGTGAQRLVGCGTGASSMREFGNCILTGRLGDVPPSSSPSPSPSPSR
jgi:hypothetical protein